MNRQQDIKYYFFSLSNFIAALGGGVILGKGVDIIDQPFLKEGSILAFFVGTALGLGFLQIIPKKISQNIARSFSILAAITALMLLYIFNTYSVNEKLIDFPAIIFFTLLSIRFGFWFYSRVLRASLVAGQQQKIAWVELGYYAGMIGGLVLWNFLGIEVGIATALIIDACLQLSAGIIDFSVGNTASSLSSQAIAKNPVTMTNIVWGRYLINSVVFLTIGIQVVVFSLAHQVSSHVTPLILASYYLGAAIAALFCKKLKIFLEWNATHKMNFARVFSGLKTNARGTSFILHGILSSACVAFSIVGVVNWQWGLESSVVGEVLLLACVFISAFFYEILALAILDRIGLEERSANNQNTLMRAYGLMGVGAAVVLWLLSLVKSTTISLFVTLFLCVMFSMFFARRRVL